MLEVGRQPRFSYFLVDVPRTRDSDSKVIISNPKETENCRFGWNYWRCHFLDPFDNLIDFLLREKTIDQWWNVPLLLPLQDCLGWIKNLCLLKYARSKSGANVNACQKAPTVIILRWCNKYPKNNSNPFLSSSHPSWNRLRKLVCVCTTLIFEVETESFSLLLEVI